jgi:hypothetical protein
LRAGKTDESRDCGQGVIEMFQVEWGMKGHWNRKEFDDRAVATEFWRSTVSEVDSATKVKLVEKNPEEDPKIIISLGGMK